MSRPPHGQRPKRLSLPAAHSCILQSMLSSRDVRSRIARRIRVLLLSAGGRSPSEVVKREKCDRATVWRTLRNYRERGVEGILDRPRTGAPRKAVDKILQFPLASVPRGTIVGRRPSAVHR